MENFGYLFAAYTIIFATIVIYVLFIWRRQARLAADVRALERRLEELGGGGRGRPARNTQ